MKTPDTEQAETVAKAATARLDDPLAVGHVTFREAAVNWGIGMSTPEPPAPAYWTKAERDTEMAMWMRSYRKGGKTASVFEAAQIGMKRIATVDALEKALRELVEGLSQRRMDNPGDSDSEWLEALKHVSGELQAKRLLAALEGK